VLAGRGEIVVRGELIEELAVGDESRTCEDACKEVMTQQRILRHPPSEGRLECIDAVDPFPDVRPLGEKVLVDPGAGKCVPVNATGAREDFLKLFANTSVCAQASDYLIAAASIAHTAKPVCCPACGQPDSPVLSALRYLRHALLWRKGCTVTTRGRPCEMPLLGMKGCDCGDKGMQSLCGFSLDSSLAVGAGPDHARLRGRP
jgi:hypothetical protein